MNQHAESLGLGRVRSSAQRATRAQGLPWETHPDVRSPEGATGISGYVPGRLVSGRPFSLRAAAGIRPNSVRHSQSFASEDGGSQWVQPSLYRSVFVSKASPLYLLCWRRRATEVKRRRFTYRGLDSPVEVALDGTFYRRSVRAGRMFAQSTGTSLKPPATDPEPSRLDWIFMIFAAFC
jgi:hypothetical protein